MVPSFACFSNRRKTKVVSCGTATQVLVVFESAEGTLCKNRSTLMYFSVSGSRTATDNTSPIFCPLGPCTVTLFVKKRANWPASASSSIINCSERSAGKGWAVGKDAFSSAVFSVFVVMTVTYSVVTDVCLSAALYVQFSYVESPACPVSSCFIALPLSLLRPTSKCNLATKRWQYMRCSGITKNWSNSVLEHVLQQIYFSITTIGD